MITTSLSFEPTITPDEITKAREAILKEKEHVTSGYYTLPLTQTEIAEKALAFDASGYRDIVVCGIGGSSLGAKALDALLRHDLKTGRNLHFIENSDPMEMERIVGLLDLDKALFIIISKSGSTIETTSTFKYLLGRYGKTALDSSCSKHFLVITDENSPLDKAAASADLPRFYLAPNTGGRFSVLSAVGLVPLGLAGHDVNALLEGAKAMHDAFFGKSGDPHRMIAKAHHYAKNSKAQPINVLFGYASALEQLSKWYVQLWGESIGKLNANKERVGMTPIGITGSVDQHSFLQLIMEGPLDKTITFLKLKDFQSGAAVPDITLPFLEKTDYINGHTFQDLINSQCDATKEAVEHAGATVDLIEIDRADAWHAGYLIYYYELLTSLAGYFLGVNTYDQPGVELGKQILAKKFGQ